MNDSPKNIKNIHSFSILNYLTAMYNIHMTEAWAQVNVDKEEKRH